MLDSLTLKIMETTDYLIIKIVETISFSLINESQWRQEMQPAKCLRTLKEIWGNGPLMAATV